jgi:flagellar hook-associated protein 1 FlgK
MANQIYNIARSGLMLAQRGLNTSSRNISNANVDGYSRQRLETSGIPDVLTGQQAASTNGNINGTIQRLGDIFVQAQLRTEQSAVEFSDVYHGMASRIDSFIADTDTSLLGPVEELFTSMQNIVVNPSDSAARIDTLHHADSMAYRIGMLHDQFTTMVGQVDAELANDVGEINLLAQNIADINVQIVDLTNNPNVEPPNDLLDKRDNYLQKLSELITTNVVPGDKGQVDVFIGYGQSLVSERGYTQISLRLANSTGQATNSILLDDGVNTVDITGSLTGGKIGGMAKFSREVLVPSINRLGQMGASFALAFNAQQRKGLDLAGNVGENLFTDYTLATNTVENWHPDLLNNTGTAKLQITFDEAQYKNLVPSDYKLEYKDDGNYTLSRLSDDKAYSTADGSLTAGEDGSFAVDGLKISVIDPDQLQAGDSYVLRPFSRVAEEFKLLTRDPVKLAAAASGSESGGVADNSNIIALSELRTQALLNGGTQSLHQAYTDMVTDIGSKTRNADIDLKAHQSFLGQLQEQRENMAGVNLDEEAANLLKYQQAYQAAANVIPIANSMFDTLISVIR